jgi:predicted PurR-regulated permease PerM
MSEPIRDVETREFTRKAREVAIHLFLVAALAWWCFLIFRPFLMLVVWGIVIAVALSPIFYRLESLLGGRRKLAGTFLILLGIGALVVPTALVSESFFEGVTWLRVQEAKESISIPPPPPKVAEWPLIGDQAYDLWTQGSENLEATLSRFGPQVKSFGSWLFSTLTGVGVAFLLTIVSIVIAGVMLIHSEGGGRTARAIGARLGGEQGEAAVVLATKTIRSVAYGVVGVAAVQAALAAVGLFLADVPAAGLWAGLVLILAVAQLPPLIILGPAIVYVLATSDSTLTQVLFTIWSVIVGFGDVVLKPLFLGRGVTIPMPVILIGAIGGLVRAGIIGLFVGAVVLAIGYNMFKVWMNQAEV